MIVENGGILGGISHAETVEYHYTTVNYDNYPASLPLRHLPIRTGFGPSRLLAGGCCRSRQ